MQDYEAIERLLATEGDPHKLAEVRQNYRQSLFWEQIIKRSIAFAEMVGNVVSLFLAIASAVAFFYLLTSGQ